MQPFWGAFLAIAALVVTVGVEGQGYRLSLSHIGKGGWRATFARNPMFAPAGYGVAATPWKAVQVAAGAACATQTITLRPSRTPDRTGRTERSVLGGRKPWPPADQAQ